MEHYVGIDFGTTNSIISYIEEGSDRVETFSIISSGATMNYIPSIVGYQDGIAEIGHSAFISYDTRAIGEEDYYERFKMYLPISGKTEDTTRQKLSDYQWNKARLPFDVTTDYLKMLTEAFQKGKGGIKRIVLSVPELWQSDPGNPGAAKLVQIAKEKLRLPLLQLIPEPISATVYYCNKKKKYGRVLLCDMGGGTFDVALCNVSETRAEVMENLGQGSYGKGKAGVLFDLAIAEKLARKIYGSDEPIDDREILSIRNAFENVKLGRHDHTCIRLGGILKSIKTGSKNAIDEATRNVEIYKVSYERKIYNVTFGDILEAFAPIDKGIQETLKEVPENSYDHLIVVGGFGRFPLVVDSIQRALNIEDDNFANVFDENFHKSMDSYLAISQGAALIAAEKVDVIEKYPHTIGVMTPKETDNPAMARNLGLKEYKEYAWYDNIIIQHRTNRDDMVHWSNLDFKLGSDNKQVEFTLFVNKKGNESERTYQQVLIDVPASCARGDIIKIGVKIDRNNRAEVYICDKKSIENGQVEEVSRLELGALIPDILMVG